MWKSFLISTVILLPACAEEVGPTPYLLGNTDDVVQDVVTGEVGASQGCIPGTTQACLCPPALNGVQVCTPDGKGWSACDCGLDIAAVEETDTTAGHDTEVADLDDAAVEQGDLTPSDAPGDAFDIVAPDGSPNCQKVGQPGYVKSYCDFIGTGNLVYRTVTYDDNGCEVTIKQEQCACACGDKSNATGTKAEGCVNSFTNTNGASQFPSTGFNPNPSATCMQAGNGQTKGVSPWSALDGKTISFTSQSDYSLVVGAAKGTPFLAGSCWMKDLNAQIKTIEGTPATDYKVQLKTAPAGSKVSITAWLHKGESCDEAPKPCGPNCSDKVPTVKVYTSGDTGSFWPKPENLTYLKTLDLDSKAQTLDVYPTEATRFVFICREAGPSNVFVGVDQFTVEQIVCPCSSNCFCGNGKCDPDESAAACPGDCSGCVKQCTGKTCGPDGCGGSCGACTSGQTCDNGNCKCIKQCVGKTCGPDGCGGQCGECASGLTCQTGTCICANPCPALNLVACVPGAEAVKTCQLTESKCLSWSTPIACKLGEVCEAGKCKVPTPTGSLTCKGIMDCAAACSTNECIKKCKESGSQQAQTDYAALSLCKNSKCGAFCSTPSAQCDQCSSQYCEVESKACAK